MDIRPARFGLRRAGLVHKNSPAWKTEMKAPGNIYFRKARKESFHAGYRANEKTDGRNDLASVLQREAV